MHASSIRRALLCTALSLVASACSSDEVFTRSGFLPDYAVLKRESAPAGGDRMVYVSPDFVPERYGALILEPVVFYPEPRPTSEVSAQTMKDLRDYVDTTLRHHLISKVQLTDTPGPGVARWQMALTAVSSEKDGLAPYQYIPVALIVTGAMALAEGGLPQQPKIAFELKVTDSQSSKPLLLLVRGGTGEDLQTPKVGEKRPVSVDALRELIDHWAETAADSVHAYIKAR